MFGRLRQRLEPFLILNDNTSMAQTIDLGFKKTFFSIFKVVAVLAFCMALAAAFVFPLWKWALTFSKSYTVTVLLLTVAALVYGLVRTAIKLPGKVLVRRILKVCIIAVALGGAVSAVCVGWRILLIPICIVAFVLYGVVNAWLK